MNNLKTIEQSNQRVLTTTQLADVYGVDKQLIINNFNRNRSRYVEGKHFIALYGAQKNNFLNQHQIDLGSKNAKSLYLWTEKGAWLHAKSLNTDQAWDAYEMLVDDYYVKQEQLNSVADHYQNLSPEVKAIFLIDERTQKMETRLNQLENNMTIDYGQQLSIQNAGKARALQFLGGKESAAYRDKSIRQKAFSAIWKDVKEYFNVDSYKNIRATELDKAIEFIRGWSMSGRLCREVELINSQLQFSE